LKKKQIIRLRQEIPENIMIIGISGTVSDSRISWLLNNILQIQLELNATENKNLLRYLATDGEQHYILLKNRIDDTILHSKHRNIQYFFTIIGLFDKLSVLKKELTKEPDIIGVFELQTNDFTNSFLQKYILL